MRTRLQRGRLTSPVLFSGPQDSSASLPFSLLVACADGPMAANSGGALVAAAQVAEGKRAGERRPAPCRLRDGMRRGVFTAVCG